MRKAAALVAVGFLVSSAFAVPFVKISLGVREVTGGLLDSYSPGQFYMAGNPSGQIEWYQLDEQVLWLDGTWQQFTFHLDPAHISQPSFTGDSVPNVDKVILEHIRFRSNGWAFLPISIWIDEIQHTFDPAGIPPPQSVLISTFTGYADNTEVMFQEPRFSGSTSGNLALTPNFSGIDNAVGHDDSHSVRTEFQWVDTLDTRWLRLTTYLVPSTKPESNPVLAQVRDGGAYAASTVTFWMRGIPEPASLVLLGLGALLVRRR